MQNLTTTQLLMLKSAMAQASEDGHWDTEIRSGAFNEHQQTKLINLIDLELEKRGINLSHLTDIYSEETGFINH